MQQPKPRFCPQCKQVKPIQEYYTRIVKGKLTFQPYCIPCCKEDRRLRYWANPEPDKRRSKLWHRKHGYGYRDKDYLLKKRDAQRAHDLAVRLARSKLLIKLCLDEWSIPCEGHIKTSFLLTEEAKECATTAAWLIRQKIRFHPDAIAELFDCTTRVILQRLDQASQDNSWKYGDIQIRDHTDRIVCLYEEQKPRHYSEVENKPYQEYTDAQRKSFGSRFLPFPIDPPPELHLDTLLNTTCWYYGIEREQFYTDQKRQRGGTAARHAVMYILHKYQNCTIPQLVEFFRKCSPNAIAHGLAAGKSLMEKDEGSLYYELWKRVEVSAR